MMRAQLSAILLVCSMLSVMPTSGQTQNIGVVQSDILLLDTERMLAETKLGLRLTEEFQQERETLIARNRKIEAELEAEEKALTELRAQKTPEEFRVLADAFDEKVQLIRKKSERAARDLERRRELTPGQFMRIVEPVLVQMMRDGGSVVILDVRSVLLRDGVVDVTDLAISRIDQEIGAGPLRENDAGQKDGGQTDTGQTDTGQTDTGQTDTGQTDTGAQD